jgi:shikimate dehydrogenase
MKVNLALVGKNISHSQSPKIYKKILDKKLESYKLLDYENTADIPRLGEIFRENNLLGLSITSPYKKHFLDQVQIENLEIKKLSAINAIKLENDSYWGTNTDYSAVQEILGRILSEQVISNIVILGSGAMANVTIQVLNSFKRDFLQYSRKKNGSIEKLDLTTLPELLLINCCAREFCFKGRLSSNTVFWDMNYSLDTHEEHWRGVVDYRDGLSLLELQAIHALKFWKILT